MLAGKLKPQGRIFIDTPKQFWLYPMTRILAPSLHRKLLRGTVGGTHLQIWSKRSFDMTIKASGLRIAKYREISEYTLPAEVYLHNMGVRNPLLVFAGRLFHRNAKWLARNKIVCVLQA
jgi:hypothetical protein